MKTRAVLALSPLALLLLACSVSSEPAETPGPGDPGTEPPAVTGPGEPPPPVTPACEPLIPRTKPAEVFVQPQAGTAPFANILAKATKSIRVMVYQMGFGPVLDGLEAKAKAGVKTRVILDVAQKDVNQKYMDRLIAAGAEVIWSDTAFTYMHAKVIIVDDAEALITTGNYYVKHMLSERNFAVLDSDPADLQVLTKLFDADWERKSPDVSCTRLLVAPVNAKQRLLDFIASAKQSVVVESMQMGDREVRDALAARKAAGVDVKVILADPSWIDANASAAVFLAEKGIPARHYPHMHAKSIVVDANTANAAAYAGSINFSWTSLTKNREVGLLVTEKANIDLMTSTFEADWAAATPF
jgi:phosphatidylserine/phosphatidylglycerophosphate/cardiolipin synthase-like enzyme